MQAGKTQQLGTFEWLRRNDGQLTRREQLALLTPILQTTLQYLLGRLGLLFGWRATRLARLNLDALRWPDSELTREVERSCREQLQPDLLNHSYRCFIYGLALGILDGTRIDAEELYLGALLHDIALENPTPKRCFAVIGAEQAHALILAAGGQPAQAERIAAGIANHLTPGYTAQRGPLATLIADAALLDLIGMRIWDCDPALINATITRFPRGSASTYIAACWRRESASVPQGRAALIERIARFSLLMQIAPFPR